MKESIDKGKELFLAVWEGYWYNDDVKRKMYEYILCDDKFRFIKEVIMKYLNKIIYEENEDGSIKESNFENFMLKKEGFLLLIL